MYMYMYVYISMYVCIYTQNVVALTERTLSALGGAVDLVTADGSIDCSTGRLLPL